MNTKPHILFVDDEERVVNLLRIMFRNEYEVHTATSGITALELIRSHQIQVIVSDQRMPEMLGIELLAKVREISPHTMRILLTGYSDLAAIVGSVNEGEVYRFINKPWDNEEIRIIVREAVEIALQVKTSLAAQPRAERLIPELFANSAGILILDDNDAVRTWLKTHFSAGYKIYAASSISQGLDILEQNEIGVIITESEVSGENTLQLLRILKQHYPMIMTVMLSDSNDAELVIRLINEAKICRVAFKPIKPGPLDLAVKAAMRQHEAAKASPVLLQQQKVAPGNDSVSSVDQNILQKLRSIGRWFSWRGS